MPLTSSPAVPVQPIHAPWLAACNVQLHVLRLDEIHPVVSGNKWYKLHFYLQQALTVNNLAVATFGGAYSNHIVATAYACRQAGFQSMGIIRGEEPAQWSHTLQQARSYGMQLHFVSREAYRDKEAIMAGHPDAFWIPEGGYGKEGAAGAALLLQQVPNLRHYTHLVCAVGTGTTLAGLVAGALPHQQVIGFSALKGEGGLENAVKKLLPDNVAHRPFTINRQFHFGGYARHTAQLLDYMNAAWHQYHLPLDFVYTAKTMFGIEALVQQGEIPGTSCVLMVHTGGLQGNLSLPTGTLAF